MGRLKEPHHGKEDYPVFIDALEGQNPVPSRPPGLIGRQDTAGITCGAVCGLSGASSLPEEVKARSAATKKLTYAVVFCLVFMILEILGGIYANSLAILSDAAHLLSDVAGFAVSLFAIWASSWEATPRQTFGFHRLEILGALVSIQIIWLITGILVYEAVDRLLNNSKEVDGRLMFIIASIGLVVNLMMICILGHDHTHGHTHDHSHKDHDHDHHDLDHDHDHNGGHKHSHHDHEDHAHSHDHEDHGSDVVASDLEVPLLRHLHGQHDDNNDTVVINRITEDSEGCCKTVDCDLHRHKDNINVRGAYLHVFGDLIQSIGVMVGGAVIWYRPDLKIIDLICTLLFSILVLGTTVKMVRDILEVLMESTPREIDKTALEKRLLEDIPEVVAVHELHIWAITVGKTLLACHVIVKPNCDTDDVLAKVIDFCERVYRINHVTIQIERDLKA